MIPARLELREIQDCFRDLETKQNRILVGNFDLQNRRIVGSATSVNKFDLVTKYELDKVKDLATATAEKRETALNLSGGVRVGTYALIGPALAWPNSLYIATDRFQAYYSNGSAWTNYPGLKRSGSNLQARTENDGAYTDIEVASETYGGSWSGSPEVPTKGDLYTKIEAIPGSLTPRVVDTVTLLNQGADVAATNFASASTAGIYRISMYALCTVTDAGAGMLTFAGLWTDDVGVTGNGNALDLTVTGMATTSVIVQLASGNVQYFTSASGVYGTAKYELHAVLERLK